MSKNRRFKTLHNYTVKLVIPQNRGEAELLRRQGVVKFIFPLKFNKPMIKAYLYQLYGIDPIYVATDIRRGKKKLFQIKEYNKTMYYYDKTVKIAYLTMRSGEEWSPYWGFYDHDERYRDWVLDRKHTPLTEEEKNDDERKFDWCGLDE
ncbi:hypothetical protein MHBO_002014 [Bonamia ostreae]|uniref:Ribosomal protein L23 n=1 Tax=Bonamia ostreae TaxID=126728 RepID=A0ABV2ALH5_9EUKA